MIDDKKIEAAANKHIETEYARYISVCILNIE